MALQTVEAVQFKDPLNPVELNNWFSAHPLAVITTIIVYKDTFYIIHT